MRNKDRLKLRFSGEYETPVFQYGERVYCQVRGWVKIIKISNGKIAWPMGKRPGRGRASLVVYKGLAKAVRNENSRAIQHWWGVTSPTVREWQRVLRVKKTDDDSQLRSEDSQERCANETRGKQGRKRSQKTRSKQSETHKESGTKQPSTKQPNTKEQWVKGPWDPWEDDLVETQPPKMVAEKTGRSLPAVYVRRRKLGVQDAHTKKEQGELGRSE